MIKIKLITPQIMEINLYGDLTHDKWLNYQGVVSNILNKSNKKLYILSDFTKVNSFDSQFAEIDTIDYLSHPKLGFNSLLCQCMVMSFMLKLSETRLQKQGNLLPVRVYKSHDAALEALRQEYKAEAQSPKERLLLKAKSTRELSSIQDH